jgi:hypothetical protein
MGTGAHQRCCQSGPTFGLAAVTNTGIRQRDHLPSTRNSSFHRTVFSTNYADYSPQTFYKLPVEPSLAHSLLRHSVQSMTNLQPSPIVKPRPTVLQAPYGPVSHEINRTIRSRLG